jgi:cytochrome P450 family 135
MLAVMAIFDVAASPELPAGPRLPRALQSLMFVLAPGPWVDACRRRYGDLVTFRSSFEPCFVMVLEPELVKQVFRAPPGRLNAGEGNAALAPILGERSVLLLDGAEHMRQRKLLLPAFHGARMRAYEEQMLLATDRTIDSWPVGEPFRLAPSMSRLTLDVIAATVFGVEDGARQDRLKVAVRAMLEPVASRKGVILLLLTRGRRGSGAGQTFLAQRRAVDELIFAEIARLRERADLPQREDVLSMLLQAEDEDGNPMTDGELRDELLTLLVAGHETSSNALSWAFELLHRNPRVLDKLRASLDAGETAYVDAVIKETIRMRPVVFGVARVPRGEPYELGGYEIPVGVQINPSIAAVQRRDDCYPDPKEFRPERFLDDGAPDTYTWFPFGGGTRRCLGASFASFEMRVVLTRVLQRTSLVPADRRPERGVRRAIVFEPRKGVRMVQPAAPAPAAASEVALSAS